MDEAYGPRSQKYKLQQRRQRDYSHLFMQVGYLFSSPGTTTHLGVVQLATPQMTMHKGLKMFGKEGVEAVRKEMQQLHTPKVMSPWKLKDLTASQKAEALAYLMFLKRKR